MQAPLEDMPIHSSPGQTVALNIVGALPKSTWNDTNREVNIAELLLAYRTVYKTRHNLCLSSYIMDDSHSIQFSKINAETYAAIIFLH